MVKHKTLSNQFKEHGLTATEKYSKERVVIKWDSKWCADNRAVWEVEDDIGFVCFSERGLVKVRYNPVKNVWFQIENR